MRRVMCCLLGCFVSLNIFAAMFVHNARVEPTRVQPGMIYTTEQVCAVVVNEPRALRAAECVL